ncbi:hypothetical protein BDN70DRAFT_404044 [Pholiota conissans]|uniref:Uncharacterized protein n=1 Tax=Pholiota conissans TaxID=109636 RepID=A0A9P5YNV5_9AGAR|nr:hypothetical protein BDN70DRAFT_404044 [Pholiota conissans]
MSCSAPSLLTGMWTRSLSTMAYEAEEIDPGAGDPPGLPYGDTTYTHLRHHLCTAITTPSSDLRHPSSAHGPAQRMATSSMHQLRAERSVANPMSLHVERLAHLP